MTDHELAARLAAIWNGVRTAFAEYRLDDAARYLTVREDDARPTREEAAMLADFIPELDARRLLRVVTAGDVVAVYTETGDEEETEVTVFRFLREGEGWRIHPAPHSCSSVCVERRDAAGILALLETEESLKALP